MRDIVSSKWLQKNLSKSNLIILEASISTFANGKAIEKHKKTIPNARLFDLKHIFINTKSPFPNTIPDPNKFELECRKIGINQDSEIIVFDSKGIYSSPRVWWLFHIMGHQNISILDGGLPNWITNKFKTEKRTIGTHKRGNFKVSFNKNLLINFEQIKQNLTEKKFIIIDARSESRFNGTGKEPREHLKSGRIPNSINIPYQDVIKNGKFKSKSELNIVFKTKCNDKKDFVFSCGSGMTACIVMLACKIGYVNSSKLFDGSWTEWAVRNNLKHVM